MGSEMCIRDRVVVYHITHNTSGRGCREVGVVVEDMRPTLGSHRREGREKRRYPSQTHTVVADIGRKPDRQHGHNSRAKKLEAVSYHDGVADGHVRTKPELGHTEATERPKLVSYA